MRFLQILALVIFSMQAHALFIEGNAFYFSDALKQTTSSNYTRTFFDLSLGFNIDKRGFYQAGWAYGSFSAADTVDGTSTTYSATAMGPKFNFFFGRKRNWGLGLTYGIVSKANYSTGGGSSELWQGTSYKAEFGYIFREDDGAGNFGIKLNYVAASYNQKLVGGTTFSNVSYSRSFIYPSICFGLDF